MIKCRSGILAATCVMRLRSFAAGSTPQEVPLGVPLLKMSGQGEPFK